ncbi:MAG TPA: hypothetical protein VK595_05960 [Vicinamibacterales bacterium]|nr:hypothetical protein [Vicinamibacterales bacterium]
MAEKKAKDPTVTSRRAGSEYPAGTHPPAAPDKQAWSAGRLTYSLVPDKDKPDKSTIAQTADPDPLLDARE